MNINLRRNAGTHVLVVQTENGPQRYELGELSRAQLAGVRELVVDSWAREHGHPTVYER